MRLEMSEYAGLTLAGPRELVFRVNVWPMYDQIAILILDDDDDSES